jgi:tetratricopeptide (TPR) repeat protein
MTLGDEADADQARASFEHADHLLEELIREFPSRPDYAIERAQNLTEFGSHPSAAEEEGEQRLRHAIRLLDDVLVPHPDLVDAKRALADAHGRLAQLLVAHDRAAEAEGELRSRVELLDDLSSRLSRGDLHEAAAQALLELATLRGASLETSERVGLAERALEHARNAASVPTHARGGEGGGEDRIAACERVLEELRAR